MDENGRNEPNQPQNEQPKPPEPQGAAQLRSAQTLITMSIIMGPLSLLVGGVLFSLVALVCGILAFVKLRNASGLEGAEKTLAESMRRQTKIALAISVATLVINAVWVVVVFPSYWEMIQSGDFAQLLGGASAPSASSASSTSSVWG